MKQVDFPLREKQVRWIAPALIVISLLCVAAVVVILLSNTSGPFIGPYG